MSLRDFVLAITVAAVLGTGIAVVYARQQHRQAYIELNRLVKQRDESNLEFSRLQLEQATWAESNRVDQIVRARLGMKTPEPADIVVMRP